MIVITFDFTSRWRTRLQELQKYVTEQRARAQHALGAARERRAQLLLNSIAQWEKALGQ